MSVCRSSLCADLRGTIDAPGDKSISHRALILAALCVGETRIEGLLEGADVLHTARAVAALGARVERVGEGAWRVWGVGVGGLRAPGAALDMGNSGTAARLLMGLCAGHPITVAFDGDDSLRARPMGRVIDPLTRLGASVEATAGSRLPLVVHGAVDVLPTLCDVPVPSAQVKSALLLAGLNCVGDTIVVERVATRDHTENMLRALGADIEVSEEPGGGRRIRLRGPAELRPGVMVVPGDPSSAAFPLVAALVTPGSAVKVRNICINPLRTGLFATLLEMGADLRFTNERTVGGEPVADIEALYSPLSGVFVPAERAPSMIDEYPILAVAAALANGETVMEGLGELRVKESDRLAAIWSGLIANGVEAEAGDDSLRIKGASGAVQGGGMVATNMDHRIAMAFLVMGCAARNPVSIDEDAMIATSFPGFRAQMSKLGAILDGGAE